MIKLSSEYWKERQAKAQTKLTNKSIWQTEKQMKKYYNDAMKRVSGSFLSTYNKVMKAKEEGREPTPADLYKLDTYWELQGQLQRELTKLGDKQAELYRKNFTKHYIDIYNSFALKGGATYSTITNETALQMIQQIWCADGKSWSERIWVNTNKLQEALNDELIHCVLTGADDKYLRQMLMSEFNVSYARADSIVRTEMAHIQTQAAGQRYKEAGIKQFEVWADEDERRCDACGKLHKKRFYVGEQIPIPAHPNCRCCILPVID